MFAFKSISESPHEWARLRRVLAACVLGAALAPSAQATALAPAVQAELESAVADYEAGRNGAAAAAFTALAARGVAAAQYNLAVMHLHNELPGASRSTAKQLAQRAAEGGFVTAQLMLAHGLENGDFGMRDLPAALGWYEIAATGGSVDAQVAIGTAYFLGRGRTRDYAQAARWYREAAKGGDIGAMYLLASMYEQGDGVERDLRLARYWYAAAAYAGDEAAPGKVKELEAKLVGQPG